MENLDYSVKAFTSEIDKLGDKASNSYKLFVDYKKYDKKVAFYFKEEIKISFFTQKLIEDIYNKTFSPTIANPILHSIRINRDGKMCKTDFDRI